MALLINIEDLLRKQKIESNRIEFKKGWNPSSIYHSVCDLTEGRSTGVPTIQAKLAANGSPRASFETTDDRLTFLVHIPIHKAFIGENCENDCENDCDIQLTERQINILKILEEDGTKIARVIATLTDLSKRTVDEELSFLRKNGFIDKKTKDNRSPWVVLKKYKNS